MSSSLNINVSLMIIAKFSVRFTASIEKSADARSPQVVPKGSAN
jgi:hypothetical protein